MAVILASMNLFKFAPGIREWLVESAYRKWSGLIIRTDVLWVKPVEINASLMETSPVFQLLSPNYWTRHLFCYLLANPFHPESLAFIRWRRGHCPSSSRMVIPVQCWRHYHPWSFNRSQGGRCKNLTLTWLFQGTLPDLVATRNLGYETPWAG